MVKKIKIGWISWRNSKKKAWIKYCINSIIIKRKKEGTYIKKIINKHLLSTIIALNKYEKYWEIIFWINKIKRSNNKKRSSKLKK
jgi:hypothetical protein